MRKTLLLSTILSASLWSGEFSYKGNIGFESSYIDHDIPHKRNSQNALRLELELKQKLGEGELVFSGEGTYDRDDEERRYLDINDLYYKHDFENSDLLIGRNTRFWGAMEFYNHVDNFNTKNWLDDPFDYDSKIGAWNIAYSYYFENSELAIIAKVHEEEQKIQDRKSVDNFLPPIYNSTLETQEDRDRPTLYLKYSGSGEETQIDYALIYQNGYDEQRYLAPVGAELRQHAYLVNKLMGYATLISGETIYKSELAYTQSDEDLVSDYAQGSIGLEHTLYSVVGKADLGLIAEYYKYKSFEDDKLGAKDFANLFADDIALGFRVTLNDGADSDILAGVSIDRDNQEKIYAIEYNTRLYNQYKLKLAFQHLSPEEGSLFQKLNKATVEFGYYF